ncbi:MAG: hypothetical protein QG635_1980 [Bacteroidota bacterium]|nr:hypothetical protein [Bacteroidota bacterium]
MNTRREKIKTKLFEFCFGDKVKRFAIYYKLSINNTASVFLTIFAFFLIGMFTGCTSPDEVDANRKVYRMPVIDDNQSAKIELNRTNIEYGWLTYQSSDIKTVRITNKSDSIITISSLQFAKKDSKFTISQPDLPLLIPPGKVDTVFVQFEAKSLGEFFDTLRINGWSKASVSLHVIVPSVEVSNVDCGEVTVSTSQQKAIRIWNYSDFVVKIKSATVYDPDNAFEFLSNSSLPMEIVPNSPQGPSRIVIIQFKPTSRKPFKARVEFEIESPGFIKNVSEVVGIGR